MTNTKTSGVARAEQQSSPVKENENDEPDTSEMHRTAWPIRRTETERAMAPRASAPLKHPRTKDVMLNTTERILSLGHRHEFCAWREANKHNPFCALHWDACIKNNPGGSIPNYNPTEWDELVERLSREQFNELGALPD